MLVTGIKSKPVYAPLQADTRGRFHLMLGMGVGAAPLLRVIDEMRSASAHSLKHTRVLFVSEAGAAAAEVAHGGPAQGAPATAPGIEQFNAAALGEVQIFAHP